MNTPEHSFRAFNPREARQVSERNLPHWRQDGAIYFVTFRLADSLPESRLIQWREERDEWLAHNPPPHSELQRRRKVELWDQRINDWLDAGHGSCCLDDAAVATIVGSALWHFDGTRYMLGDYVVMPNHVHALVSPGERWPLQGILHSWKSYSAHQINRLLRRHGALWQDESFDHIVRDDAAWRKFTRYIATNADRAPVGAARLGCGQMHR